MLFDDIVKILDAAKKDIQSNMSIKKINATGRTSASLIVECTENAIRLVSRGDKIASFGTVEEGHSGKNTPSDFKSVIFKWSNDKGIAFKSDKERNLFAYKASNKIKKEGTKRYRNPEKNIYTPVLKIVTDKISQSAYASVKDILK